MVRRLAALAAALLLFGFAGAVVDPKITRYEVSIKGLDASLRVVHLSDLHFSWLDMPPRRIARIVTMANAQKPDLVLLTGDYMGGKLIDFPGLRYEIVIDQLKALTPRLGTLAVMGNHDNALWSPRVFARAGIPLLAGSWIDVGPLAVAGATSAAYAVPPEAGLNHAIADAPQHKPIVSMSHEPDTFQGLRGTSQLHFSGHTHGGQIVLPLFGGPRITPFQDAHRRGLYRIGDRWLVVSAGLGTSWVPIRIGVRPEIVVVDLVPYSVGRNSGTER